MHHFAKCVTAHVKWRVGYWSVVSPVFGSGDVGLYLVSTFCYLFSGVG